MKTRYKGYYVLNLFIATREKCGDQLCSLNGFCDVGGFPLVATCYCNNGYEGNGVDCKGMTLEKFLIYKFTKI